MQPLAGLSADYKRQLRQLYTDLAGDNSQEQFDAYCKRIIIIIPHKSGLVVVVRDWHNPKIAHVEVGYFKGFWSISKFKRLLYLLATETDLTHVACKYRDERVKRWLQRTGMQQIADDCFAIKLRS